MKSRHQKVLDQIAEREAESGYTEEQLATCDKFLHPNGACYAYVQAPAVFAQEVIPEGIHWSSVPVMETVEEEYPSLDEDGNPVTLTRSVEQAKLDDDGNPITRQKTLVEYVDCPEGLDEEAGTFSFPLCAIQAPHYRKRPVNRADILDWIGFFEPYGVTADDLLTREEWVARQPVAVL